MHYAVKLSDPMSLRAFSSPAAAREYGSGYHVFENSDDLAATQLTHDELLGVHWLVANYEPQNIKDRVYLCDLIMDKIHGLGLTPTDIDLDMVVTATVEEAAVEVAPVEEPTVEEPMNHEPRFEAPMPEVNDPGFKVETPVAHDPGFVAKEPKTPGRKPFQGYELAEEDETVPLKCKLGAEPYYKYHANEKAVFKFLARSAPKSVTIKEIATIFKESERAVAATKIAVRNLRRKMIFNGDQWEVFEHMPKSGGIQRTYTIGERKHP